MEKPKEAILKPLFEERIDEYLKVVMYPNEPCKLIHIPSGYVMKQWVAPVGLERGAFLATKTFANRVSGFDAITWHTKDSSFLYPCTDFKERFLDKLGHGQLTHKELAIIIMQQVMEGRGSYDQ